MLNDPIIMTMKAQIQPIDRSYDQLLVLAKKSAPDPTVFDEYTAAFWRAQASNNRLDFYYTSMADQTLDNYVEDYTRGISFQDSHEWGKLGLGQSIMGELTQTSEIAEIVERKVRQVHANFFTLLGVNLGGHKTDDFIAAIRSGTYRDVSIGFYARDITCSICGKQSFHWWEEDGCTHLPGVEYEVGESEDVERKKKIRQHEVQLCWASVNDGRLLETSQVYDGATPDAAVNQVIVKANALNEERMISGREVAAIERRYGMRLKEPRSIFAVGFEDDTAGRAPVGKATDMATRRKRAVDELDEKLKLAAVEAEAEAVVTEVELDEDGNPIVLDEAGNPIVKPVVAETVVDPAVVTDDVDGDAIADDTVITPVADAAVEPVAETVEEEDEDVLAGERIRLADRGIKLGKNPVKAVRALADALQDEQRRSADLVADAAIGKQYRKDVIDEALAEGVRARGDAFKRSDYEAILGTLSVDQVKVIRDDLKAEALRALTVVPPVNASDRLTGAKPGDKPKRRRAGAHRA